MAKAPAFQFYLTPCFSGGTIVPFREEGKKSLIYDKLTVGPQRNLFPEQEGVLFSVALPVRGNISG